MAAYNFARHLKAVGGLTPYEHICKVWTSVPDRFMLDPFYQMPGPDTYSFTNFHAFLSSFRSPCRARLSAWRPSP